MSIPCRDLAQQGRVGWRTDRLAGVDHEVGEGRAVVQCSLAEGGRGVVVQGRTVVDRGCRTTPDYPRSGALRAPRHREDAGLAGRTTPYA
jgi:hypothetical protein